MAITEIGPVSVFSRTIACRVDARFGVVTIESSPWKTPGAEGCRKRGLYVEKGALDPPRMKAARAG